MRRFRGAILITQLMLLALALAKPRMDLPQTAFNEADTPVNQATVSVVLRGRSALVGLRAATTAFATVLQSPQVHPVSKGKAEPPIPLRSCSLLNLLCTLLC